jgi:uncharacterized membrane protein YgdD (TMEM256/DUF423 family)
MAGGCVSGFLAVALGAFGAHALKSWLSALPDAGQRLDWWDTAAHYHLIHAVAAVLASLARRRASARPCDVAAICFLAGTLLFSGSLYAMTLSGVRALGAVTPFGGLTLLAGWAALGVGALRARTSPSDP